MPREHEAIVGATGCADDRLVYTLQATGRRDDRPNQTRLISGDRRADDRPVWTLQATGRRNYANEHQSDRSEQ
jgi:hypothetical protein